jgi:hypothetical protein
MFSLFFYFDYDCNFKKGWNVLYLTEENFNDKYSVTTQKPSEVKMEWIFEKSYHWDGKEEGKGSVNKSYEFKNLINKLKLGIAKRRSETL